MKKQLLTGALALGTLTGGFMMQINPAEAASPYTTSCSPTVANLVTNTLACEVGTQDPYLGPNNDTEAEVNAAGFFNLSDWVFVGKPLDDIGDNDPGNDGVGTWDISDLLNDLQDPYKAAMILFKGGNDTAWTAYSIDAPSVTSGQWTSPLFDGVRGKNTSHISLYVSPTSTPIPTPALLPGLIGMGFAAWRKRKMNQSEANA